jgi:isopenicillin N synthase-like dioxygenase
LSGFQHGVDVRAGAHSDYGSITLLFQQDGQPGLEIMTPTGEWAPVPVRPTVTSATAADASQGLEASTAHPHTRGTFPPILINIGDLLSYWTSGLLKSTVHRVVFPTEEQEQRQRPHTDQNLHSRDRYSMAYFCHPVDDTQLIPVPSELVVQKRWDSADVTARRELDSNGEEKMLTAREHLAGRLAVTYGGSGGDYM